MKIKVRLLKEWENAGEKWPLGQLLGIEEAAASPLIEKGICEVYEPGAEDVVVESVAKGDTGLKTDDLKAVVKAIIKETFKDATKGPGFATDAEAEYSKTGGFNNFAHFCHDVYRHDSSKGREYSEQMQKWAKHSKATGLSEGVAADGGFLVPIEFRSTLMQNALESAIIRSRATTIPMATNNVKIPVVVDASHASSVFGGVIIYKPAEAGTKTKSKPAFGEVSLRLEKLIGLVYTTDELLEDSPISMQPLLTTMFSQAIAFQEDEDFINGSGAGEALGILNAPCTVSVGKEGGQAATSIVTENITKMWSRVFPASQGRAVWLANNDCFPDLSVLSLDVGTGGSAVGLLQVNTTGIAGAPAMTLLGRPLILTEHCQTIGTTGDIYCADWSQYLIGQRAAGALKVDSSIHVQFTTDETAFRFVMRYDGQPWWVTALTPKHSSNTLSPFVKLDVRE